MPDGLNWVKLVHSGQPLSRAGITVIDAHAHLGAYHNFFIPNPDASSMVAVMDRLGVTVACVSSLLACHADVPRGNEMTAAAVRAYPDRFIGYASANPHHPERVRPELERAFDELGLSLIKIHPSLMEYPVLDPGYEPLWQFAAERRAIVLSHTWTGSRYCSPDHFAPLAHDYPDITFILGHSGGAPGGYRQAIQVAREHPNVYLDLCRSTMSPAWVMRIIEGAGVERVLWGSDFPFFDPTYPLGRLACIATLDDRAKRQVFGGNMARLLREHDIPLPPLPDASCASNNTQV